MRIGIDAEALLGPTAGVARVIANLLREFEIIDPENLYFLYAPGALALPFQNPRWRQRIHSLASFEPRTLWRQADLPRMAANDKLDVFWGPTHFLPLRLPSRVRMVLTVHDVVWRRYPETMTWRNRFAHHLIAERSIRSADSILADSEATKRDLERLLGVSPAKIGVAYPGISTSFRPHDPVEAARYVAGKFGVAEKYICAVGTVEPRKNLAGLMEAIGILKSQGRLTFQLAVAGAKGWGKSGIAEKIVKWKLTESDVKFLGYVPDEDLPLLYSGAGLFIFPSVYEGFGLPLLEAMACGTPVASSNRSSLPEVAGDAALYFNPESVDEMSLAIERLLRDEVLRGQLADRGRERVKQFSWQACARTTLAAFHSPEAL
jgi:glycosyltransferase involved in cell wall biosynthesis